MTKLYGKEIGILENFQHYVEDEVASARIKFPTNEHQLAALGEEVGELFQAMIEYDRGKIEFSDVYIEAVQVAAMAARVAIEGDKSFKHGRKE